MKLPRLRPHLPLSLSLKTVPNYIHNYCSHYHPYHLLTSPSSTNNVLLWNNAIISLRNLSCLVLNTLKFQILTVKIAGLVLNSIQPNKFSNFLNSQSMHLIFTFCHINISIIFKKGFGDLKTGWCTLVSLLPLLIMGWVPVIAMENVYREGNCSRRF